MLTLLPAAHIFNKWEQRRAASASSGQNTCTKKWRDYEKWFSVQIHSTTIFTLIHIVLLLSIWGVILLPVEQRAEYIVQYSLHAKKGGGWWETLWPWCISISLEGHPEGLQWALALLSTGMPWLEEPPRFFLVQAPRQMSETSKPQRSNILAQINYNKAGNVLCSSGSSRNWQWSFLSSAFDLAI